VTGCDARERGAGNLPTDSHYRPYDLGAARWGGCLPAGQGVCIQVHGRLVCKLRTRIRESESVVRVVGGDEPESCTAPV
jgi:hypothetical protein